MQKTFFHENGTLLSRTFLQEKHVYEHNRVPETPFYDYRQGIPEDHSQKKEEQMCATDGNSGKYDVFLWKWICEVFYQYPGVSHKYRRSGSF